MTPHGIIVLSNHDGLAFPPHSRDPRPAGSQPPFGVGQNLNPYPCDYYTAFASSGILYPLTPPLGVLVAEDGVGAAEPELFAAPLLVGAGGAWCAAMRCSRC